MDCYDALIYIHAGTFMTILIVIMLYMVHVIQFIVVAPHLLPQVHIFCTAISQFMINIVFAETLFLTQGITT